MLPIAVAWCLMAPQNNLLFMLLCFFSMFVYFLKNHRLPKAETLLTLTLLLGTGIGMSQGGLLAPKQIIQNAPIQGVLTSGLDK